MILSRHPDAAAGVDQSLKFIGYWRGTDACLELPSPLDYVDTTWSARERQIVLGYLGTGQPWEQWFGTSWCRFHCDVERSKMGSRDFTDGLYVWPQGFTHYLEHHAVRPAQEFIDHVLLRADGVNP